MSDSKAFTWAAGSLAGAGCEDARLGAAGLSLEQGTAGADLLWEARHLQFIHLFQDTSGKTPSFSRNVQLPNKAQECGRGCDNISTIQTLQTDLHPLGDIYICTRHEEGQHLGTSPSCF